MPDPMENLNQAADALNQVAERAGGFLDVADERIDAGLASMTAKEGELDAWRDGAANKLTIGPQVLFDTTVIYSKDTAGVVADPGDNTQTEWFNPIPLLSSYLYVMGPQYRGVINLARAYAYSPGHYEDPQYGVDKCSSRMEFVFAGTGTSSADINAALEAQAVSPTQAGFWSYGSFAYDVPILVVPGANPGGVLFARFKNFAATAAEQVPVGTPPQEIIAFGGNANFAISSIQSFKV